MSEALHAQAEKMREEILKAAEKVRENPAVKSAIAKYDEQMAKLKVAMDSDTAKKIFDVLTMLKDGLIKAIEAAQNSPVGKAVIAKLNEYQAQAQAKLDDLKAKAMPKTAAAPAPETPAE